jgi:hypothetical protein
MTERGYSQLTSPLTPTLSPQAGRGSERANDPRLAWRGEGGTRVAGG